MSRYIPVSRVEGDASRQAHCDLPEGTYEREISKEGFFGPASFFHHRHPPTAWANFEGPLRPHAFDLGKLHGASGSPWDAAPILRNAHLRLRYWRLDGAMEHLARNADGDELLFVHAGRGDFYCDYGHLAFEPGDYLVLPRGTMWRLECAEPLAALLIEATNASYGLPERGLLGGHALFDPAILDTPTLDERFRAQQGDAPARGECRSSAATGSPRSPIRSIRWMPSAGTATSRW